MYGGWRFLYASYRSYEPSTIVPVHKQMGAGWRPGFFWQVNPCRIMSKLFSLHGGSLLKPPLHSAQGRHPHKGIENGGLEMYFKTAVWIKLCNGRTKLPTPATVFFFPRLPGQDSLDYLI